MPAFRGYSIEQKCKSLPPVTFKLGKSRQQINLVSQGYGRRKQDETLARKRVGVGGLIYTGQRRPF